MGKDTKIGLLVGVLVVILFALVFFGGGGGPEDLNRPQSPLPESALGTAEQEGGAPHISTTPPAAPVPGEGGEASEPAGEEQPRVVAESHETAPKGTGVAEKSLETGSMGIGKPVSGREASADSSAVGEAAAITETSHPASPGSTGPVGEVYLVKPGDCYYSIAKAKYGKASLWPIIKAANKGKDLYPGMKIVIPPLPPERVSGSSPAGRAPAEVPPAPNEYVVKPNDNLWKIAVRHFGDGTKYLLIYEANRDRLRSPDEVLRVGMRLRLPPRGAVGGEKVAASSARPAGAPAHAVLRRVSSAARPPDID